MRGEFLLFVVFLLHRNSIVCRATVPFDRLVVFGDSNSDEENVFRLTGGRWPPTPPFHRGRFSNGPMWTEQLHLVPVLNYAYGSGTTDAQLVQGVTQFNHSVPGVRQQIELYRTEHQLDGERTLFIVWAGGNDYFFNASLTPRDVVFSLLSDVQDLISAGAKHFLVMNQPPIDEIPIAKLTNETTRWKSLVVEHNALLSRWIRSFDEWEADVSLNIVDMHSFVRHVLADLHRFGLTSVDRCWETSNTTIVERCPNPDTHVFIDEFHFSTRFHRLIADFVRKILLRLYEQ